ncbi:MAG: aminoacetone oxidase family FAD-binding enzyme [Candidatus Adlerbacteria bacterium]|nr:aminoacetone oxidase family FAD-binding enzyme [Candidatus Adlerbacteria bacterium]
MKDTGEIVWDVCVIGGGPAGMMAAGQAAALGARVVLLEKNTTLGKKLLITGGGRCNVCNGEEDVRKLLSKFKGSDKFLFSAFSQWSTKDTLDFFHTRGMDTKVEALLRVFPASNTAQSVWDVLVQNLKKHDVTVLSNSPVTSIQSKDGEVVSVTLKNKKEILAKKFIVATGGKSRPETGSTGEGYEWLKELGHNVTGTNAALVPLAIKDMWVKKLAGVSAQDVKITTFQNNVKQNVQLGKILFTHVGVSGPTILNMSRDIGELLNYGDVNVEVDFAHALGYDALNTKLQEVFAKNDKKKLKNSLSELLPTAVVSVLLELAGIDGDVECNSVTRTTRLALLKAIKHASMDVDKLLGLEKAVITSGGVDLEEVDFKTMQSRLFPNLYLVGDILNINRPSGGYSLQLCWTTGHVAGTHAALGHSPTGEAQK